MTHKFIFRVGVVLLMMALFAGGAVSAQDDGVAVTIFINEDSLTLYVPGNQPFSLNGFTFEVLTNDEVRAFPLSGYDGFSIPLDDLQAPRCFRLVREGRNRIVPSSCSEDTTLPHRLVDADVFWHNSSLGTDHPFRVTNGSDTMGICTGGQSQCEFVFVPVTPEITPGTTPEIPPSPTPEITPGTTPDIQTPVPGAVMVADFDTGNSNRFVNNLGGGMAGMYDAEDSITIEFTTEDGYPGGDFVKLGYYITVDQSGFWLQFPGDRYDFSYFAFDARTENDQPVTMDVELKLGPHAFEKFSTEITPAWSTIRERIDLSGDDVRIDTIVFVFNKADAGTSGTVYIDNIRFED